MPSLQILSPSPHLKTTVITLSCLCLGLISCSSGKQSDRELFGADRISLNLSSTVRAEFVPFTAQISAYLESKGLPVERKVDEMKWIVKTPDGQKREIINDTVDYTNTAIEKESFWHMDYTFSIPGNYRFKLILNDGEYESRWLSINARENDRPR